MNARSELWDRLVAAGVVSGAMPERMAAASPWYITTMMAVAAWIASIFLLIFLGLALKDIVSTATGAMTAGAIVCIACAVVMHVARDRIFIGQLAVALSLAGQALIAFGIFDQHWRSAGAWIAFAAVESVLAVAAPNFAHRILTTLAAAWSLRFAFAVALVAPLFAPLCAVAFVAADRASRRFAWGGWLPISAGLALAALFTIPPSFGEIFWWPGRGPLALDAGTAWFAAAFLAAVLVVVVAEPIRHAGLSFTSRTAVVAFATAIAAALAAQPVPGVTVGLIVLIVAYSQGRRALCGLALASMIVALSHYYFALDTTLLAKSAALLATGIVLLAGGFAVRLGLAGEPAHA